MMLALLIYGYANGLFSSHRIERATERDVAARHLAADPHPDHDTICAFRRNNLAALATAFVAVLELARELKLLKLGTGSLDGAHIKASASKDKNVTCARAQREGSAKGPEPKPPKATPEPDEPINLTDPDARLTRKRKGSTPRATTARPPSLRTAAS